MSYRCLSNQTADRSHTYVKLDIIERGYVPLTPESRDHIYDLLVERSHERFFAPVFETIQIKTARDGVFSTQTRSGSDQPPVSTGGKPRNSTAYADYRIDWIAVFDPATHHIYYYHYDVYRHHDKINIKKIAPDREFGRRTVRSNAIPELRHSVSDTTSSLFT